MAPGVATTNEAALWVMGEDDVDAARERAHTALESVLASVVP